MNHLGQFILNHLGLWLTLISILILIFINESVMSRKRGKEISTAAAVNLMNHDNAVIVDLRDVEIYRAGHIINAIQATEGDFEKPKLQKYKDTPLILVCPKGLQSAQLATKLRTQGFNQPMVMSGGMAAWVDAGLPLVKGKG